MNSILVDTSVWIDHLHDSIPRLDHLLDQSRVVTHPMIIGELALGSIRRRTDVLQALAGLRTVDAATHDEVVHVVEKRRLFGIGLRLVDVHLLASALIAAGTEIWTRDKRLRAACETAGVALAESVS